MYAYRSVILKPGTQSSGSQAQECTQVPDPPALWDQVHTLENVVPCSSICRNIPLVGTLYGTLYIVPQSEQNIGLHDSSNCQIRKPLVYEPNPRNNYDFPSFDPPPQYHIDDSQQFYCCDHCGGPHYRSDCQTVNVFYEHAPYDNHDSSGFDQPS
ncbi:hypothetical protein Tco_0521912 [Tanacetum coccineum]